MLVGVIVAHAEDVGKSAVLTQQAKPVVNNPVSAPVVPSPIQTEAMKQVDGFLKKQEETVDQMGQIEGVLREHWAKMEKKKAERKDVPGKTFVLIDDCSYILC